MEKPKQTGAAKPELDHVRHDPGHVLAPGLFRSLGPGDRKRMKLDVIYEHGDDKIEFRNFEPLGADDMRVLQGLVAMSGPEGLLMQDHDELEEGPRQLMLSLFKPPAEIRAAKNKPDTLVLRGSFRRVAREIGMSTGGPSLRNIRKCIERLYSVTVIVETNGERYGTRLLANYSSDDRTGELYVALNPRISQAVIGSRQHTRIDLDEVRQLRSDPARLIHQRLSGWIDAGKTGQVGLDTLAQYVWPEAAKTPSTERYRRAKVREALDDLKAAGWHISEGKSGICKVRRPRLIRG